jgi:type II secretory ATPase GspE/PulE/Tfp pilus assembly ATPase PilB-like protein/GAF domain-containing protein
MAAEVGDKRAALAELARSINAARRIEELLPNAQRITAYFQAERSTIYAVDTATNELYSLIKSGYELKEIRVSRETTSIAGFVAVARAPVNIADVYDAAELGRIHPRLRFDSRWDKASGFRTRSMLTLPIVHDKNLLGLLQIINRRDGHPFSSADVTAADEICRLLAAAITNLNRTPPAGRANRRPTAWDDLVDSGALTADALDKALAAAAAAQTDAARFLLEKVGVPRAQIEESLARFHQTDFYRFTGKERVPEDLRPRLRVDYLKRACAVPVERRGTELIVVIDDPGDFTRTDTLRSLDPDRELVLNVGFKDEIIACIEQSYGIRGDVGLILKELSSDGAESGAAVQEAGGDDEGGGANESDSAVIKLANQIIIDAFRRGSSDIHIEPNGKDRPTIVRFRIDGDCTRYQEIPAPYRNAVVARLKIMAGLDISERRKPQDGKIRFRMPDRQIELRVATLPTVNGNEDVVMRILATSKPIPLDEMGMNDRNLVELKKALAKPYGLILCVGPTGSGKTTTLHSALGHINTPDMKIWTAEDPVEITQEGLRQVQVQAKIGLHFAAAMRAFLRADPDVIMVGEMRDEETASIGVEASLTGHLVLSTLHTNSASETITRLIDMGVDPFSFGDALVAVLAQRLARAICGRCREPYLASEDEVSSIIETVGSENALRLVDPSGQTQLFRGRGCEACGNSGYKGRLALHELLINNDDIRHAVSQRAPVEEIRRLAVAGGMTTLLQDGMAKVLAGKTDLKQVLAVSSR